MLINSVRGQVKSLGGRLPRRNPGYFHTLKAELPEAQVGGVGPIVVLTTC